MVILNSGSSVNFFEILPVPYLCLDPEGVVLEVNPAWLETFIYKEKEVIGQNFNKFLNQEFIERFKKNFLEFKKTGTARNKELILKKSNDEELICLFNGNIAYDDGNIKRIHCIITDITSQLVVEAALLSADYELNGILDYFRDGILILDNQGKIIKCNTRLGEIFDISPEEITRMTCEALFKDYFDPCEICSSQAPALEFRIIMMEIGSKDFEVRIKNLFAESGALIGRMIVVKGISEILKTDHEIINSIEKIHEKIGRSLHDGLCQELLGIAFMVKILEKKLKKLTRGELAESANKISELINKSITGARELSRGLCPVDIGEMGLIFAIEELITQSEEIYQDIDFSFIYPDDIEIKNANQARQVYYIIKEALNNAIRHSGSNLIEICITVKNTDLMFIIKDYGQGFDLSQPSNGLGLRIIKKRLRLLDGSLRIRSSAEAGTEIRISYNEKHD